MRRTVRFALLMTLLLGLTLFSYVFGLGDRSFMDFAGWVYLLSSSLMHAGLIVAAIVGCWWLAGSWQRVAGSRQRVAGSSYRLPATRYLLIAMFVIVELLAVVNRYVFQLYHFHINGFVLDLLFSEGAGDIFVFSGWLYVKAALILLAVTAAVVGCWWLAGSRQRVAGSSYRLPATCYLLITLLSQGLHVWGAATLHPSILESDALLPYYFPLSMNSALDKWGIIDRTDIATMKISENSAPIDYPLHPLTDDGREAKDNVVLIVVDAWNFRTLTEEGMPNVWRFKERSEFYARHCSSSNGTRGGIFGLFTGLSSYYWKSFEYSSLKPLLVSQLQEHGYAIQVYPSANFGTPPFDRLLFKGLDIHTTTEGETVYDRDCRLTEDFLNDMGDGPFFAFLFYDLAHAIALPKEKNTRFRPAWDYADYTRLGNSTDPTPFFNLYRNCLWQVDSLIGVVTGALEARGLLDNTLVVITGDHGQEFNENHKNYWGHTGNYSRYQTQVPLIVFDPATRYPLPATGYRLPKVHTHRTTHYDIVPTLMQRLFGIENPPADYSMGTHLHDSTSRGWHIVGNDLNYAFITEDGHIIEKQPGGNVKVFDRDMNVDRNYKLPPKVLNDNLQKLNRFYK